MAMSKHIYIFMMAFLCLSMPLNAHTIDIVLDAPTQGRTFIQYLIEGFKHIIPLGLDHILFILCLSFVHTRLKDLILQATLFTCAHTLSLGLSMYNIVHLPANLIEPLIALTIVFLAVENMLKKNQVKTRLSIVFLFGLIHGLGFAGALGELGLPKQDFALALFGFNLGVEIAQIAIIMSVYFVLIKTYSHTPWYWSRVVVPLCVIIAMVAGFWTVERIWL